MIPFLVIFFQNIFICLDILYTWHKTKQKTPKEASQNLVHKLTLLSDYLTKLLQEINN